MEILIRNIIDMLAVYAIVYYGYSIFRNTNSSTVWRGFLFAIVIFLVGYLFRLNTLVWMMQRTLGYVPILLAILFQPELRTFFSRIGRQGHLTSMELQSLEEIQNALHTLQQSRMGALIVLQQKTGLQDLVEISVPMEASVQADLISSIFWKGSPLHDGAIICAGDQIIAARVMIPFIQTHLPETAKRTLGTRHRAALALSERTDAICIVLSEESGEIALADDGEIWHIPVDQLKSSVYQLIQQELTA